MSINASRMMHSSNNEYRHTNGFMRHPNFEVLLRIFVTIPFNKNTRMQCEKSSMMLIVKDESNLSSGDAAGMEFNFWLSKVGRDRSTGYRWVSLGMVAPINIMGRLYITTEEIARFWSRARSGEFSKMPSGICAKPGPKAKKPNPRELVPA